MRVHISQGLAILLLVTATLPVWSQGTGSAPPDAGGTRPKDSGAAPAATGTTRLKIAARGAKEFLAAAAAGVGAGGDSEPGAALDGDNGV